ncbi:Ras family GTPase [Legionella steigerwaltii]|uniref:Ras family GTPase n=1 Tax=Legionella steigerwaltii TaxID=460 RepID=A0A378LBU9_9GAMM|nr:Rab family GTPase [Legionella steigerwaltii]KTD79619.1 Ras family GTPase [Legionella steigerwaltii]STY24495.1 Ras family GTPase [Legionella steigerwaltii]
MEFKREYDEHFKIILLGDNAVGKSCLMLTYCGGTLHLSDEYMDTMGVDQQIKKVNAFNKKIQLRIWDASGAPKLQEKVIGSYFSSVDGALICFDLTRIETLQHTRKYVEHLRATKKDAPMIIIGCKADLDQRRAISAEQAKDFANELGLDYLEVSALKKVNIDEPFTRILKQIYIYKQLNKVKPTLEGYLNDYLKFTNPKNQANFFIEQGVSLSKEEEKLRAEYKTLFGKLFACRSIEDLVELCGKASEYLENANDLHERDNPVLSSFVSSPLSKALKQTLNVLTNMLGEMMGISTTKALIAQRKTVAHAL